MPYEALAGDDVVNHIYRNIFEAVSPVEDGRRVVLNDNVISFFDVRAFVPLKRVTRNQGGRCTKGFFSCYRSVSSERSSSLTRFRRFRLSRLALSWRSRRYSLYCDGLAVTKRLNFSKFVICLELTIMSFSININMNNPWASFIFLESDYHSGGSLTECLKF